MSTTIDLLNEMNVEIRAISCKLIMNCFFSLGCIGKYPFLCIINCICQKGFDLEKNVCLCSGFCGAMIEKSIYQ